MVHVSITDRCNLRCRVCDIWKTQIKKELSTKEWIGIIKQLRAWLGPFSLKFAGGEPLVRKDITDIIKYAYQRDIFTGLSTNGLLINSDMAKDLVSSGLNEIHVSLDSSKKEVHDFIRNKNGVYDKVVNGIFMLNKWRKKLNSSLRINVACVITRYNLDTIKELVSFVEGGGFYSINFQPMYQNFGAKYNPRWFEKSDSWPTDIKKIDEVIDFLIEKRKATGIVGNRVVQLKAMKHYFRNPLQKAAIKCKAGTKDIAFDPYGNMLLCFNKDSVGNALKKNPKKIWKNRLADTRRNEISLCKRNCNLLNCNFEY